MVYFGQVSPLLTVRQLGQPWEVEVSGQGITEGATLVVPLLRRGEFEVAGPGATLVTTWLDESSLPPRLRLTARTAGDAADTRFTVAFHYGATTERLSFFVVPKDAA